jgi:hypothetical protein
VAGEGGGRVGPVAKGGSKRGLGGHVEVELSSRGFSFQASGGGLGWLGCLGWLGSRLCCAVRCVALRCMCFWVAASVGGHRH